MCTQYRDVVLLKLSARSIREDGAATPLDEAASSLPTDLIFPHILCVEGLKKCFSLQ